jgi:hydroxymethylglutaryl-CoA lyase
VLELPPATTVVEVGPRDGLQSLGRWVPTTRKVRLVDALSDAGFPVIEVTSFASPRVVPLLRDAEQVLARIRRRPGTVYRVLAPNRKGLARALDCQVDEVVALTTVSAEYTRRNQSMTVEQATEEAAAVYRGAREHGLRALVAVGMAMCCPYEGVIPPERALAVVARLHEGGVRRIYLAGSLGMEDPRMVGDLVRRVREAWPDLDVGFHAHDMAGFGAANALAALEAGATSVEGSICGLGGGVVLPGTVGRHAGNLATEDLVHLLNCAGVSTGVPSAAALAAARQAASLIGLAARSRLVHAGVREDLGASA